MISGRLTLTNIDQALQQLRGDQQHLDERIQNATQKLARLRQAEAASYRSLAEFRIDQLKENLIEQLDQADRQAQTLLEQRQNQLMQLRQQCQTSLDQQTALEEDRQRQNRLLEEAAQQLEYQLQQTHTRLAEDNKYLSLQTAAQAAIDTAAAAEDKTQQAEQDQQAKGLPYRSDKLFMYLWQRHYGTEKYRANPLTRTLDRWLAKYIGYEAARRNYFLLLEIPKRLKQHTERLQQKASEAIAVMERYEREQEIADGIEPLEANQAQLEEKIASLDQSLQEEEQNYAELLRHQESFASGSDDLFRQAVAVLVDSFRSQPITEMRAEAEDSYGYADDSAVQRLAEIRRDKTTLQDNLSEQRALHQRAAERLHHMENIRRQFKRKRFDAPNSRFFNSDTIEVMLAEFLRGLVSADRLWRTLRKSQRFQKTRSQPHPGGISLPRGIKIPGGIRLPKGIKLPGGWGGGGSKTRRSSRPSKPGGFRTGGGF